MIFGLKKRKMRWICQLLKLLERTKGTTAQSYFMRKLAFLSCGNDNKRHTRANRKYKYFGTVFHARISCIVLVVLASTCHFHFLSVELQKKFETNKQRNKMGLREVFRSFYRRLLTTLLVSMLI